jgi:membrane peptidoglycan carboxypeptidase
MVDNRAIDGKTAEDAKHHPAILRPPATATPGGTWFSDWVGQEALDATGTFPGEMRVRTTLDPALQSLAEEVVGEALQKNADRNVAQAALVAMRPDGAVLAMVGGRDYKESQFNRAVQALRQPGSAFKLFVFMAALRNGAKLDDTIDASAPDVNGWMPENYGGRAYGRISLADAFAQSINTAAVRLALQVGLDNVIAVARDFGIDTPLPRVPSLALGSAEVTLLNLTAAYAAVLAGQAPVRPWGVASFASPTQPRLMSVGPLGGAQHATGDLQHKLIALLRLPVERGTAREAALPGLAAGKTGTTQDNRDAWFLGFNETLAVGIWVGNDDRSPMRAVTGGSLPAQMWKEFMTKAASRLTELQRAPAAENDPASPIDDAPEGAGCDYRACAKRYHSFSADDCTYQPYGGGPRRSCEFTTTADPEFAATERSVDNAVAGQRRRTWPASEQPHELATTVPFPATPVEPESRNSVSRPVLPAGPPTRHAGARSRGIAKARTARNRPAAARREPQQRPGFGSAFFRQADALGPH